MRKIPSPDDLTRRPLSALPFLFDGRMRRDGVRRGARPGDHHPNAGATDVQPKAEQPARER